MEFRIIGKCGSSKWMNCADWTIEQVQELTTGFDLEFLYGDDWHMEYR